MNNLVPSMFIAIIALAIFGTWSGSVLARLGFPLPPKERRIGHLDGLRGYLALAVMAHHFVIWVELTRSAVPWSPPALPFFNSLGAGGVGLFFMVTGCLFYGTIQKGVLAPKWRGWATLYVKRVFRIEPLLICSVILCLVLAALRAPGAKLDAHTIVAGFQWVIAWYQPPLFGVSSKLLNANVLWSLRIEWTFYFIVLPICAAIFEVMPRSRKNYVPALLLIVFLVFRAVFHGAYFSTYWPLFAVGMIARLIMESGLAKATFSSRIASILGVACLLAGSFCFRDPYTIVPMTLYGAFFVLVVAGNDFWGLLQSKGAIVLGECSFAIYLLHGIVLGMVFIEGDWLIQPIDKAWLPILLPALGLLVIITAAGAYLFIERAGIDAGSRLAKRLTSLRTGPASLAT